MTYAIFRAAGQQFRAESGATLRIPRLQADPGSKVTFDDVLLTSDGKTVTAGQPTVKGAKVVGKIVRHGRDRKIVVFRFKRRKNYRRKTGHRQPFTEVQITDLKLR
jgi:large subunit ribosomal protein L21